VESLKTQHIGLNISKSIQLLLECPSNVGLAPQVKTFIDGHSSNFLEHHIEKQPLILSKETQNSRRRVSNPALSCYIGQSKALNWSLLGQEEPQRTCGLVIGWVGCPEHPQFFRPLIQTCSKPSCSNEACVSRWALKATKRATERLWQGIKLYQKIGQRTTLKHIVVSPPKTDYHLMHTKDGFAKLKNKVITQLKKAGCGGGSIVFHHSRHGQNISPHFHIIGSGYIHNTKEIQTQSGYVVFNAGKRTTELEVLATLKYQLSHCSLSKQEGKEQRTTHVISYFGQFSYTKVLCSKVEKILMPVICGHCGGAIKRHNFEDKPSVEEMLEGGDVLHLEIKRTYSLRRPNQASLKTFYGSVSYENMGWL